MGLTGLVEGEVRGAAQFKFKSSLPQSYTRKAPNDEFGLATSVETILGAIPVGGILARACAMDESWGGRVRFVYVPQLDPFAGLLPSVAAHGGLSKCIKTAAAEAGVEVIDKIGARQSSRGLCRGFAFQRNRRPHRRRNDRRGVVGNRPFQLAAPPTSRNLDVIRGGAVAENP
jgi:hypothetical protein